MLQALGPPAVMLYLELSLFATAMALCAGVLVAGLAAWATSKSSEEPPVRTSHLQAVELCYQGPYVGHCHPSIEDAQTLRDLCRPNMGRRGIQWCMGTHGSYRAMLWRHDVTARLPGD